MVKQSPKSINNVLFSHEHYSNIYWNDNQITTNLDAFLALVGGDINLMLVSIFWSEWFVGKLFSNLIWTGLSNHLFLAILAINFTKTKLYKNEIDLGSVVAFLWYGVLQLVWATLTRLNGDITDKALNKTDQSEAD